MLRCRRCRKCVVDSTSLSMAQWTVGKLNCQFCSSRLGSFNFLSRTECPCGRDATVHLNKSRVDLDRVDLDRGQRVLIFQPRRSRPRIDLAASLAHVPGYKVESPEMNGAQQDDWHVVPGGGGGAGGGSSSSSSSRSPVATSSTLAGCQNDESFSFSPLYCITPRRRRSVEDAASVGPSCFCPGGAAQPAQPARSHTAGGASANAVACLAFVSRRARAPLHQLPPPPPPQAAEDTGSSVEDQAYTDSVLPPGGEAVYDGAPEEMEEVLAEASPGSQASSTAGLNKRERNRLKGLRRKQRRRERWLLSQLEPQKGSSADGMKQKEEEGEDQQQEEEEEEEELGDAEGLTCPVCLDVYFRPHSCQPCGHVFCEPCLRTVAKHRAVNTPCPLCRSLILHTNYEEALARTAQQLFPRIYCLRQQSFQDAATAKWPLPHFRKRYSPLWGEQRRRLRPARNWHFVHHGGLTLNMMDLSDVRVWFLDIVLLVLYIHSSNWLLSLLVLAVLLYVFLF